MFFLKRRTTNSNNPVWGSFDVADAQSELSGHLYTMTLQPDTEYAIFNAGGTMVEGPVSIDDDDEPEPGMVRPFSPGWQRRYQQLLAVPDPDPDDLLDFERSR